MGEPSFCMNSLELSEIFQLLHDGSLNRFYLHLPVSSTLTLFQCDTGESEVNEKGFCILRFWLWDDWAFALFVFRSIQLSVWSMVSICVTSPRTGNLSLYNNILRFSLNTINLACFFWHKRFFLLLSYQSIFKYEYDSLLGATANYNYFVDCNLVFDGY